jgi:hypothetical protein
MPLDINRIDATVTGFVSRCHTYVQSIETANFGKFYSKALDGLNYYLVDSVAKPALQKAPEWVYDNRAVNAVLKNKGISILVVAVVSFVFFVIWLHPKGPTSKAEEAEGLNKTGGPTNVSDEKTAENPEEDNDQIDIDEEGTSAPTSRKTSIPTSKDTVDTFTYSDDDDVDEDDEVNEFKKADNKLNVVDKENRTTAKHALNLDESVTEGGSTRTEKLPKTSSNSPQNTQAPSTAASNEDPDAIFEEVREEFLELYLSTTLQASSTTTPNATSSSSSSTSVNNYTNPHLELDEEGTKKATTEPKSENDSNNKRSAENVAEQDKDGLTISTSETTPSSSSSSSAPFNENSADSLELDEEDAKETKTKTNSEKDSNNKRSDGNVVEEAYPTITLTEPSTINQNAASSSSSRTSVHVETDTVELQVNIKT